MRAHRPDGAMGTHSVLAIDLAIDLAIGIAIGIAIGRVTGWGVLAKTPIGPAEGDSPPNAVDGGGVAKTEHRIWRHSSPRFADPISLGFVDWPTPRCANQGAGC